MSIPELKTALRRSMRLELDRITPEIRQAASFKAAALLREQSVWRGTQGVLFYAPIHFELDLSPLLVEALARGARVALPRWDGANNDYHPARILDLETDLSPGRFGILEPGASCPRVPWNQLDLALVPGVAFGQDGGRLGRGKGFYDRLLASFSGSVCGICFDFQFVDDLPLEPHDRRLDYLLTPTRWIECKTRAVLK